VTFKNVKLNKKKNPFDERCLTKHEHDQVVTDFIRKNTKREKDEEKVADNIHGFNSYMR